MCFDRVIQSASPSTVNLMYHEIILMWTSFKIMDFSGSIIMQLPLLAGVWGRHLIV